MITRAEVVDRILYEFQVEPSKRNKKILRLYLKSGKMQWQKQLVSYFGNVSEFDECQQRIQNNRTGICPQCMCTCIDLGAHVCGRLAGTCLDCGTVATRQHACVFGTIRKFLHMDKAQCLAGESEYVKKKTCNNCHYFTVHGHCELCDTCRPIKSILRLTNICSKCSATIYHPGDVAWFIHDDHVKVTSTSMPIGATGLGLVCVHCAKTKTTCQLCQQPRVIYGDTCRYCIQSQFDLTDVKAMVQSYLGNCVFCKAEGVRLLDTSTICPNTDLESVLEHRVRATMSVLDTIPQLASVCQTCFSRFWYLVHLCGGNRTKTIKVPKDMETAVIQKLYTCLQQ